MKKEEDIKNEIDLEISQLHYSVKVVEYIRVKKNSDVELIRSKLRVSNKIYILSVYPVDTKDDMKIYHVYGQEEGSDNAFILGALLDDVSIVNKISVKGVLHEEISRSDKIRLELLNLSKMFNSDFVFKRNPKTGEIVPQFSLDGMLAKQSSGKTNPDITVEDDLENLKKKYEKYGYHEAKCPKGSPFCIHSCNEYDKTTEKCGFICPFSKENCDTMCKYYVDSKLLNCLYTKIKDGSKIVR